MISDSTSAGVPEGQGRLGSPGPADDLRPDGLESLVLSVEEAIARGSEHVVVFGNIFLPRAFRNKSPAFHFDLAELLAGPNRFNAFMVFRGAAKTTLLRAYILQRICYGLSNTIMIVSATQDHSVLTLSWIRNQVERNKRVQEAFRLRKGSRWAETICEIIVPRIVPNPVDGKGEIIEETVTILAFGITGQIRGFNVDDFRPDLIVADDIQTEENIGTEEQRKKTNALFFGALANSLAPSTEAPLAKLVLLNTPMAKGDVITTALDDPLWISKKFSVFDSNGDSVWDERYPTRDLKLLKASYIRRGQYDVWMREYECTIVKSEYKTFDVGNLMFWKDLPQKPDASVTAIDPASSESKKASDNVVLTAVRKGADIYVAAYRAAKGQMPDKVANDVFTHKFLFGTITLVVETVAYQKVLKWYLEKEMIKRRIWMVVKELKKDGRAKSDRIIQALVGIVAQRHLFVHESMLELINQMDQFEPDKDAIMDILDALAMAVEHLDNPLASGVAGVETSLEDQLAEERRSYGELTFHNGAP